MTYSLRRVYGGFRQLGRRPLRAREWLVLCSLLILLLAFAGLLTRQSWVRSSPPIVAAALQGDEQLVRRLIESGKDLNSVEPRFGWTALHVAAFRGDVSIAARLIGSGANVNAAARYGYTPLHNAADAGKGYYMVENELMRNKVAEELLQHGANPNSVALNGNTPLHLASARDDLGLVRLLLQFGAKVNVRAGAAGVTPLDLAKTPQVEEALKNASMKEASTTTTTISDR